MAQTARERLAGAVRAGCDGIVLTLDEAATLLNALEAAEAGAARYRDALEWYASMLPYMTRLDAYGQLTAGVIEDAGSRARAALAATEPEGR